ncbi:Uncharacterized protein TCM_001922 [Theobroma cacao]|uniref:Uncharacterized protein n=1 Tax=Theobroma cacao TaxID=3641 RepID=A0A061DLX3_THECC|nr:Uncharacterized protein TCM_001922 [Theobroma cacao]
MRMAHVRGSGTLPRQLRRTYGDYSPAMSLSFLLYFLVPDPVKQFPSASLLHNSMVLVSGKKPAGVSKMLINNDHHDATCLFTYKENDGDDDDDDDDGVDVAPAA